jgi:hypothetical protein
MCGKHDMCAFGYFIKLVDEDCALGLQAIDHELVMHDLVAHIDRCSETVERLLHNLDGTIDAGAETAWCCQHDLQRRFGRGLFSHRQCHLDSVAPLAKDFPLLHS